MKGTATIILLLSAIFLVTFSNAQITASSQWTWMKGDNTVNATGVYGTQGVAAESNKPGARGGRCPSWKDASGNFWLFGGYNYAGPNFNDLWKYSPSTNQWTWMNGSNSGGQASMYGTLGVPAAGNRPGARYVSSTWTDASGNLWLFGGASFNDLWKYNPSTNQWAWMNGANTPNESGTYGTVGVAAAGNRPGARSGSSSWTDAAGNLWLFGGTIYSGGTSNYFNDLWKYNPNTNQWTWMNGANITGQVGVYGTTGVPAATNTPGARSDCHTWTDASGNFWLFGGGPTSSNFYNDLWKYDPAINQWACMSGTSALDQAGVYGTQGVAANTNKPGGRGGGTAGTDAAGTFYLFGGYGKAASTIGYLNDFWKFDPAAGQWTWLKGSNGAGQQGVYGTQGTASAGNLPGSRSPGASWMDGSGNFWLFAGAGVYINNSGFANDLWKLSPGSSPALPNLTLNDVSHNEGNSGTTTFTFTVSLSAPAPAGGVSFNISTANGTATAGSDYVAKSLTGQTIAAGSSTYTFEVLVNGDLQYEPDETFYVNVTNATGAVITDGQGIGTILNDDIAPVNQTISFTTLSSKTMGDPPFKITATATSGLPVTFRIVSGPATISGDTITLTAAGTVIVEANQPGNYAYNPAPPVQQSFTVLPDMRAPDLAVQQVVAGPTLITPDDTVTVSWKVTNLGTAVSAVNWTERIYMQAPDGQNRTFLKSVDFANSSVLAINQFIDRNATVVIPHQFNIGDQGVFVVELIPGAAIHEAPGGTANNTGVQPTPWAVRKLLSVQLSSSQITEGSEVINALVSRTGSLANALTVNTSLNYPGYFSVPASVVIPAGQAGASFTIAAPDNATIEGVIKDTLRLSAASFQSASAAITRLDNDKASLSITNLPAQVVEGGTVTFKVATNLAPAAPLPVYLTSNNQARFPVPPVVTISAGSLTTDVTVSLAQNTTPEVDLDVNVMAGAANHNPANATIRVKDDDLPNLELVLQTNTVSESGGPFATQATLRRTAGSTAVAFTANLSASLPNTLILPGSISLAAGQNSKSFNVGVIDNTLVDSQRQVIITAAVFVAACGCSAPPASSGSVSATLTVDDNDGPSLKLTAAQLTLPEGAANAVMLRITRNTYTTAALLVNLSSSDTTEAILPATATIPVGATYVDVPITTLNDGIADGNQQVYLYARSSGYATGSVWVIVTDLNKPDLQIAAVSLDKDSVQATDFYNYRVSVKNSGFANAPAGVLLRGYLSKDDVIDAADTVVSEDVISVPINAGQTAMVINAVRSPNLPGRRKLLFWVNPTESLSELLVTNNTSQPYNLTLLPGYTVSAQVSQPYFTKGTAITITGAAVRVNGSPAANEPVETYIITNGLRRKVLTTTNSAGNYTAQFVPLAKEAGHYTVGASFPGMDETTEQDAFDILGVKINGGELPQFRITLNDTLSGVLTVQNMSNRSLHNFTLAPATLINGIRFRFDTLSILAGNATATLAYRITSSVVSQGTNFDIATLQAKATEGIIQPTDVYYFSQAPTGYLVADLTSIRVTASQSVGERLVECKLVNRGRGTTGAITVQLPQVAWLTGITPRVLPSMAPGDTAMVMLKFLTLPEVPFNYPITGNIVINTQNGNFLNIPFSFEKVSQTTGTVKVTATNQFTYFSADAPKVRGALVKIRNYFSGVVYAEGYTDTAGVFIASGVPEGRHRVTVEKEKHLPYDGTVTIEPGDTVATTAFLNYQAITFSWNVVPTAIQDQYDITLTAQFETHIPIPVVTIEIPDSMPRLFGSEVYAFNATLTNHGLITANNVRIVLPESDPEYEFVTNYEPADLLAQQSIQVPVLMRRRTSPIRGAAGQASIASVSRFLGMQAGQYSMAAAAAGSAGNCRDFAGVIYYYKCNIYNELTQQNGSYFRYSGRICSNGPIPIIVTIPPNYPTFPCAICPTYGLPPASGGSPMYKNEKKSCIQCINKIISVIKDCTGSLGGVPGSIICVLTNAVVDQSEAIRYTKCFPWPFPKPLKCTMAVIEAIQTCLLAGASGERSTGAPALSGMTASAGTAPLGDVFREIANNLQAAVNAYQTRDNWSKEYFGEMRLQDAWLQLAPMLDPLISNLDSIVPAKQATILANMAGYNLPPADLQAFFTRWNTSLYARSIGVLEPNTSYPGIINWKLVKKYSDSLITANNLAISKGFTSIYDMHQKVRQSLDEIIDGQSNAVCASVTVQFSQQLTMTREAFEGTLEIFNGHPTDAMDSLSVNIQITDAAGVPSNGLFEIQTKGLTGLANITGTGAINAQQKGSVKFLFIPESGAAPQVPKTYNFGGSVRYWDPYVRSMVTMPLSAIPLTVNPSPNLALHYFMERNILGDDALTSPDIEPSVPAELAVMVENQGYGPAVNMTISSAQPKVVDNEKGLAINFNLIGSNFQGQPLNLGVTNINFGTIPPLQTRVGQWYFTSSLLGKFVSYRADVVHANSFGNPELSLVKSVRLHELSRSIRDYSTDDGINDFLVNDIFDVHDQPDIIYFSQGGRTARVNAAATGSFSSPVPAPSFTNALTVTASDTGWNYIQLDDPGSKLYDLISVTRSDGQVIPITNAWLTFVTLPVSRPPVYENKFHFADRFTTLSPVSYTVVWKPRNLNVPRIDSITGVPRQATGTQVQNVQVVFNKRIDPATFTYQDLTLIFQGSANIMDTSVIITQLDSATFNINLATLTTGNGFYALTVQAAGIKDVYGISGLVGKQATWSQFLTVPTVQAFQGIPDNHFAAAFDTLRVLFNLPIDESTVTPARFSITKNGVLQSGSIIIDSVRANNKLFYLSGLRNILIQNGTYLLTVDLPNIRSTTNVAGMQAQSISLTVDNTGPVLVRLTKSDSGRIDPQHFPFITIQFDEDVSGFNTTSLRLTRNGQVQPLAITQLSGIDLKNWVAGNFGMLTYPDGAYTFTVNLDSIRDAAGNRGHGSQQIAWTVNRSATIAITNLRVEPDLGFSDTDGITTGESFNVAFSLSDSASAVTVSQFDLSGEAELATLSKTAAGNVSVPVTLLAGGNTGIKITATGANGRNATAQKTLVVDQVALTAEWNLPPNQTLPRQPDTITLSFSAKLLNDAGFLATIRLKRNGAALSTTGLSYQQLNDTLYRVYGIRQAGNTSGTYELSFNLQPFRKYSSGRTDSGMASVLWTVQNMNHAPIANAGPDILLAAPGQVVLNATASSDPDGDAITYRWVAPAGIVLNDSTAARPSFTLTAANRELVYAFLLIVSDGTLSTTDVVNINLLPSMCPGTNNYFTLQRPGDGYTYQWQIDSTGGGFVNLENNAIHAGVGTDTLHLQAPPTAYAGYRYRCVISKGSSVIYSTTHVLKFVTVFEGTASTAWENIANWSCGMLPDRYTDVVLKNTTPHVLRVNSNAACRSLTVPNGGTVIIASGYNLELTGK